MSILKVKDKDGKFVDVPVISGRPASIRVGEVKLLEPNSEPTIENVGTEYDAIFNFGIPKGEYIVQGEDFRLDLSDYVKQKQLDKEIQNRQQTDNNLQSQIKSLASGSPKGVYSDVTALKTANPDTGVYITTDNGHIYSWTKDSESAPVDLGVYQATSFPELEDVRIGYDGTTYDSAGNSVREQIKDLNDKIKTRIKNKSRNFIDSKHVNNAIFESVFPNSDFVYFEVGKHLRIPNNTPLVGRIFFEDGTRVEAGSWFCEDEDGNELLSGGTNSTAKTLTENAEKITRVGFYIGTIERKVHQGKTIKRIYFGDYKSGDNLYDDYYVELESDIDYKLDIKNDYLKNNSNYPFADFIKMPLSNMSATNYKKIIDLFVDVELLTSISNPYGYFVDLIKLEDSDLKSKALTIRLSQFVDKEINNIGIARTQAVTDFTQELITIDINSIDNDEVIGRMVIRTKDLTSDFEISNIPYEATALSQKCYSNDFKLNSTVIINQAIEKVFNLPFENDTFSFGVLTDTHYTNAKDIENCVKAVVEVVDKTPVDALMCLGDQVPGNLTKERTLSQMRYITGIMAQTRKDFYAVKGNHDVNDYQFDAETMNPDEWLTTEKEVIRNMILLTHSKNNINHCSTNKSFYYVDYEDKKVRCIFLNTSERVENQTIWGVSTDEQKNWVKNVALNFSNKSDRRDWKVIIYCHIIPVVGEFTHNYGYAVPGFHDMLVAFKNGSSSSSSGYECDFTSQGSMKLVGVFGGHVHDDCYGVVDGINYIVSNCTTPQRKYDSSPQRSHYKLRDISNNVFMCDFTENKIYKVKIGSGVDETWDI